MQEFAVIQRFQNRIFKKKLAGIFVNKLKDRVSYQKSSTIRLLTTKQNELPKSKINQDEKTSEGDT